MKHYILIFLVIMLFSCKKENSPNRIANYNPDYTLDTLKINQIQFIGSHNSYRIKTSPEVFSFLNNISFLLPAEYKPNSLDYTQLPLATQLDEYGMRNLEIDIYNDPNGGHFSNRAINLLVGLPLNNNIAELSLPGFKTLHIPDIDYNTHHFTFKSALTEIKKWSDIHTNHLPLYIYIEPKENTLGKILGFAGFTKDIPYNQNSTNELDNEIKAIFGNNLDKVITPDEIKGNFPTLKDAVVNHNFPTIANARGKIFFIIGGGDNFKNLYKNGHPSLTGRTCFIFSKNIVDETAFLIYDNPIEDEIAIKNAVQQGFIIRTRSDDGTTESRNNDYTKFDAAKRSGAQIISTDYYKADDRAGQNGWSSFKVRLPNNAIAITNPINTTQNKSVWDYNYPLEK